VAQHEVIIELRGYGLNPHPVDVATLACYRRRRSQKPRWGLPRQAQLSCTCMRAILRTGQPVHKPEDFEPFLRVIKQSSNVVVNLTTGASPYMPVEYRVKPAEVWKPEVASLNMGSMNFGLFQC